MEGSHSRLERTRAGSFEEQVMACISLSLIRK
jgi:hypothetical protein